MRRFVLLAAAATLALSVHAEERRAVSPLAIYGTFAVEIHPNVFAFGVLTTLFSFSLPLREASSLTCGGSIPK